jgi:hypothetical protein
MRKLGSVELYNTFKKMNTSIKFKQPVMLERVVNNRDAEDVVANNMEELPGCDEILTKALVMR